MLLESCTEIDESSVQEAGVDVHGSGQVTFQEKCGSMMQSQLHQLLRPRFFLANLRTIVKFVISFNPGHK